MRAKPDAAELIQKLAITATVNVIAREHVALAYLDGRPALRDKHKVNQAPAPADSLHAELRALIASSRQRLAGAVNAGLTRLYWNVGQRLRNLCRIVKFATSFPDAAIVSTLSTQLGWSCCICT